MQFISRNQNRRRWEQFFRETARRQTYTSETITNKIIHAESFDWELSNPDQPKVICHSNDVARWQKAEIDLTALMALIGRLMH
jgi:hypothetical protein